MFGPCFAMQHLVSFLQASILAEKTRACCFSLTVFLLYLGCVQCRGWFAVCACISWSDSLFGPFIYITIEIDQHF